MDDYRDSATVYMNDYTMHGCYFQRNVFKERASTMNDYRDSAI